MEEEKRPETTEDFIKLLKIRNNSKITLHPNIHLYGYFMVFAFSALGICFIYGAFISKLLPESQYSILKVIKDDYYFCYLFPLAILPTCLIIYFNWLAFTHFVHN
jgi:hypothetical protein